MLQGFERTLPISKSNVDNLRCLYKQYFEIILRKEFFCPETGVVGPFFVVFKMPKHARYGSSFHNSGLSLWFLRIAKPQHQ